MAEVKEIKKGSGRNNNQDHGESILKEERGERDRNWIKGKTETSSK